MPQAAMVAAVVVVLACALSLITTTGHVTPDYQLTGPCAKGNHAVVDDMTRDVTYGEGLQCDYALQHVWYRFLLNGSNAQLPTTCVPFGHCDTYDPVWMDLQGGPLPAPGQERQVQACANNLPDCCARHWNFTVHNCGPFYVYRLASTPGCYFRYCVETVQV